MNFFKNLFSGSSAQPDEKSYYIFTVKCRRCGETLEGRVDLSNDLSVEYEEGGDVFYTRKVLMGEGKCFQRVEVSFKFSTDRKLLEKEIVGGEFV